MHSLSHLSIITNFHHKFNTAEREPYCVITILTGKFKTEDTNTHITYIYIAHIVTPIPHSTFECRYLNTKMDCIVTVRKLDTKMHNH